MTKKQRERVDEVLFPQSHGIKCDFAEISKLTGIPKSTLYKYKERPDKMPYCRVLQIVTAMGLDSKACGYLLTGLIFFR